MGDKRDSIFALGDALVGHPRTCWMDLVRRRLRDDRE